MAQHKSAIILSRENYKKFLDLGDLYAILKAQTDQLIKDKAELLEALEETARYFNKSWTGKSKFAKRITETINTAITKHQIK